MFRVPEFSLPYIWQLLAAPSKLQTLLIPGMYACFSPPNSEEEEWWLFLHWRRQWLLHLESKEFRRRLLKLKEAVVHFDFEGWTNLKVGI